MTAREWAVRAAPSGLALVISVGATLAATELGHYGAPGPALVTVPPAASGLPAVPSGAASLSPSGARPTVQPSRASPPAIVPPAAGPVLAAARGGNPAAPPRQSTTPAGAPPAAHHRPPPATTSPPPPPVTSTTPPPRQPSPSPRPQPSPASTCAVSVTALIVSACVKIGGR